MALKLNLRPDIERDMEELVPLSGARSKTEYINQAIAEKNEKLRKERQIEKLRKYFSRATDELRAVNRELRSAARRVDED
jgi:hypothetical protein